MVKNNDNRTTWERRELLQWSNHRDWSLDYLTKFAKNVPISRLQEIIDDRFEKLGKAAHVRGDEDRQACYNAFAAFFSYEEIRALFPVPPSLAHRLNAVLYALDGDFLEQNDCYLGSEAAVYLQHGNYADSDHLLFFCGSKDGFREVLICLLNGAPYPIFVETNGVEVVREPKAGMHEVIMVLGDPKQPVTLEFRRENRIEISGDRDSQFGLPVLCIEDLFAEKVLEAFEAFRPGSSSDADMKLETMIQNWGRVPEAAMEKARSVYGNLIDETVKTSD